VDSSANQVECDGNTLIELKNAISLFDHVISPVATRHEKAAG